MIWLVLAALLPAAHAIECKQPVQHEELEEAFTAAEASYMDLDPEGFRDKVNEISALLLPCVEDAIGPQLAARYHRDLALQLSVVGDEPGALGALQAAKNADPEYVFDDAMLPADHPLRVAYEAMEVDDSGRNVPEPKSGSIAFDGVNGRFRPETPVVFQRFDATGRATDTLYLGVGDSLPTYRAIPRQRNLLIGCAGGALGASVTTWALAMGQRGSMYKNARDPAFAADKLDAKRAAANGLTVTSTLLFGASVGCGTGAYLIGER
ncbi:MAG: hypothetical protein EP330_04805 [Deltaproteobacteria bacterium]|nr:MAG: hypothetical protein EP330_04805 [Deltaproteobacteria bacterium]